MTATSGIFAPLRIRPFRLLFFGQVVSNLGDWLGYLAIGGLLVGLWGPSVALAVASASVLVSAALLSRLPGFEAVAVEARKGFWSELGSGFSYISRRRALQVAIGSISAAVFLVFLFDT